MIQATLIYLGSFIGVFVGTGCLFQLIEGWNNQFILQSFGKWGIILTGSIGTVVHEGSHALMCLMFGHQIQEIQWFRPFASQWDGRLGYVSHTWNPKNMYQSMGNFFIGIAPLLGGTLVMILLFRWLLPDAYQQVIRSIQPKMYAQSLINAKWQEVVNQSIRDIGIFFKSLVQSSHLLSWRGALFLISVYSISTHMGLSLADLKGSFSGIIILAGLMLGIVLISRLFGWRGGEVLPLIIGYNVRVGLFLCFGLVCSVLTLVVSWICWLVIA